MKGFVSRLATGHYKGKISVNRVSLHRRATCATEYRTKELKGFIMIKKATATATLLISLANAIGGRRGWLHTRC